MVLFLFFFKALIDKAVHLERAVYATEICLICRQYITNCRIPDDLYLHVKLLRTEAIVSGRNFWFRTTFPSATFSELSADDSSFTLTKYVA